MSTDKKVLAHALLSWAPESSIPCAWGGFSHKRRLTHPRFFKIQIFSYGLKIPDITSNEAMEGK